MCVHFYFACDCTCAAVCVIFPLGSSFSPTFVSSCIHRLTVEMSVICPISLLVAFTPLMFSFSFWFNSILPLFCSAMFAFSLRCIEFSCVFLALFFAGIAASFARSLLPTWLLICSKDDLPASRRLVDCGGSVVVRWCCAFGGNEGEGGDGGVAGSRFSVSLVHLSCFLSFYRSSFFVPFQRAVSSRWMVVTIFLHSLRAVFSFVTFSCLGSCWCFPV